jgi:hypothetical protein
LGCLRGLSTWAPPPARTHAPRSSRAHDGDSAAEMYTHWLADLKAVEAVYGRLEDSERVGAYVPSRGRTVDRNLQAAAAVRAPSRASQAATLASSDGSSGWAEATTAPVAAGAPLAGRSAGASRSESRGRAGDSAARRSGRAGSGSGPGVAGQSPARSAAHQRTHLLDELRQVSQHKLAPLALQKAPVATISRLEECE